MTQKKLSPEKIDSVILLYSNGKIEEAIDVIKALNKEYPNEPLLINLIGACYNALGQLDKAVESYQKAIKIKPDYVDALYNIGNIFRQRNQLNDAINSYEKVIDIKPDFDEAQFNLGVSLQELGKINDAIDHYEKALITNPKNAGVRANLGFIFQNLGQLNDAIEEYDQALEVNPLDSNVLNNLGTCFRALGHMNEAIECFEKAIELKPDYADGHYNLGFIYQDLGQIQQAISNYEHAIDINNHAMAYHSLSHLKKYKANDPQIKQMQTILSSKDLSQSKRIHICLALANIYEKLGNQLSFFKYLDEGNNLQKNESLYSLEKPTKEHSAIKELFSLDVSPIYESSSEKKLIFIVGMPRSGTSLVEQIISSHSKVYGAGELNTLPKLVTPIIKNFIAGDINQLTEKTILFLRNEYLDILDALNIEEQIVSDKLPLNFQYIGFIMSAFPNAKIIHLNRDARAVCWSNYKYYFESKNNGYSNNFEDLAGYYGLYVDLMNFWHKKYPNKIYDIYYEDLTVNQEEETRKLLKYCDLEWEDSCLDFHSNERAVKTVSALQVRKKMYQGSSEAWKKHWAYIQPLTNALKSF